MALSTSITAPDKIAPKAALTSDPNVTTTGGTSYTFTVKYTDNVEVKLSTLRSTNIKVTGPNKFGQMATLVSDVPSADGTSAVATYSFTPPGGSWSAANNGVYTLALGSKQVTDTSGNAVKSGTLGTFTVDTISPMAALKAANVSKTSSKAYAFTVTYTDNIAVKVSTIGSQNILVTGPGGFSQQAKLQSVNSKTNKGVVKATYQITPPGGSWNAAANGVYTIALEANQVADAVGNVMAAQTLGTFSVAVPAARPLVVPAAAASSPLLPLGGGIDDSSAFATTDDDNRLGPRVHDAALLLLFA